MSDVFISYAGEDKPKAKLFAKALGQQGLSVWWDRDIPLGKSYGQVIAQALDSAKWVVVLWSKKAVVSDWVKDEAEEGKRRRILVPTLIPRRDTSYRVRTTPNCESCQMEGRWRVSRLSAVSRSGEDERWPGRKPNQADPKAHVRNGQAAHRGEIGARSWSRVLRRCEQFESIFHEAHKSSSTTTTTRLGMDQSLSTA